MAKRGRPRKHKETGSFYAQEIKRMTAEANRRINEYNAMVAKKEMRNNVLLDQEITHLQELAGTTKRSKKVKSALQGKSVNELYHQYRELKYFLEWDVTTPEGMRAAEAKENEAFTSFKGKAGRAGMDKEEWRQLVEIFGAVGPAILEKYGSEQIVENFRIAPAKRKNLVKEMTELLDDPANEGLTQTQLFNKLNERMGIVIQE